MNVDDDGSGSMSAIEAILWAHLEIDLLLAEAEDRLPLPARVPVFARETVRPTNGASL